MRILRGEEGAALVTALMMTMLSLVIAMALLYAVTTGSRISASQKRYRSALAASQGGLEVLTRDIVPQLLLLESEAKLAELENNFSLISLQISGYGCLQQKLRAATGSWSACTGPQTTSDPAEAPDMTFTLKGDLPSDPAYKVAAKIVDTVPGNSDLLDQPGLEVGNSVAGGGESNVIHPRHLPGMFNVWVQGVGSNTREKARLSVLYAY